MGRTILGAIVGYVVIFIWTAVTMSLSWIALGADFAFQEGSTATTIGWALLSLVLGIVGAVIAGWVAAKVAKSRNGALGLAIVIVVLGVASALYFTFAATPEAMTGDELAALGTMEAANAAIQPIWYVWLLPVVGFIGAYLGGSFAYPKKA